MGTVHAIHDITLQLKGILDQQITAKNRQTIIEQVTSLLEKRASAMEKVAPPYTEQEKLLGQEIVQMNEAIQTKMNAVFSELKTEMKQSKKQKKSNRTYINPYENVHTVDGLFMDRKK